MVSNFGILNLGTTELLIILAIILLLFGGKKLPQLSRSIGESLKELRKGVEGSTDDKHKEATKTKNDSAS